MGYTTEHRRCGEGRSSVIPATLHDGKSQRKRKKKKKTTEHRGRIPNVFVPDTGLFINSTCIRTNQCRESIKYSAVLTERIRRQRRNTRTIVQHRS